MRADRKPLCIGVSLFSCVALATGATGAEPPAREGPQPVRPGDHGIGRRVGDLAFTDLAGAAQSLGRLADSRIVVFACTSTSCPIEVAQRSYLSTLKIVSLLPGSTIPESTKLDWLRRRLRARAQRPARPRSASYPPRGPPHGPATRCDQAKMRRISRRTLTGSPASRQLIQAAQNVVPVAATAGDKIESLRQWASGRCLLADRAGVYSRPEGVSGGRVRRVVRANEGRREKHRGERARDSDLLPSR